MSECDDGKERVHGSTARADGGRSTIARSEPRHAATVPPVCGAVRRVPPTITEGTGGIGDPCVSRSPRPGETRESVDARGVRRGDPFSLPGDLGPPRRGATHPVPPPGERAIAGDPERSGGRAAALCRESAEAPGDADGRLWRWPAGERAVCADSDRHRQPADADPGASGQGGQGSLRHAEPAAVGDVAGVLAPAATTRTVPLSESPTGQSAVADGRLSCGAPGGAPCWWWRSSFDAGQYRIDDREDGPVDGDGERFPCVGLFQRRELSLQERLRHEVPDAIA